MIQLGFLGHVLRMPPDESRRKYSLHTPTHGKKRPGHQITNYLTYIQNLMGWGIPTMTYHPTSLLNMLWIVVLMRNLWSPAAADDADDT